MCADGGVHARRVRHARDEYRVRLALNYLPKNDYC
jgi:hypothetical protein